MPEPTHPIPGYHLLVDVHIEPRCFSAVRPLAFGFRTDEIQPTIAVGEGGRFQREIHDVPSSLLLAKR